MIEKLDKYLTKLSTKEMHAAQLLDPTIKTKEMDDRHVKEGIDHILKLVEVLNAQSYLTHIDASPVKPRSARYKLLTNASSIDRPSGFF